MADLRSRALGYLRAGAVTILSLRQTDVGDYADPIATRTVVAQVEGHQGRYIIDGRWAPTGGWATWTCTHRRWDGESCPHIAAVQLVVGFPSAAAPTRRR